MPYYEFECKACGIEHGERISLADFDNPVPCPNKNCKSNLTRLISVPARIIIHDVEYNGVKGATVMNKGQKSYNTTKMKRNDGKDYYLVNNPAEDPSVKAIEKEKVMDSSKKFRKTLPKLIKES